MSVDWWAAMDSDDPGVGAEEIAVYGVLVRHANGDANNSCYPGYATIGRQTRLCRSTIAHAVHRLRDAGLLTIQPRPDRQGNLYILRGSTVASRATVVPDTIVRRTTVRGTIVPDTTPCSTSYYSTVVPDTPEVLQQQLQGTTPVSCPIPLEVGRDADGEQVLILEPITSTTTKPKRAPKNPAPDALTPEFMEFYAAFPRHENRKAAAKAWNTLVRKKELPPPDEVMAAVARYAASVADKAPEHIAHPSTWLNAGRWTDEPTIPTNGQTSAHFRGSKEEYPAPRIDLGVPKEYLNA